MKTRRHFHGGTAGSVRRVVADLEDTLLTPGAGNGLCASKRCWTVTLVSAMLLTAIVAMNATLSMSPVLRGGSAFPGSDPELGISSSASLASLFRSSDAGTGTGGGTRVLPITVGGALYVNMDHETEKRRTAEDMLGRLRLIMHAPLGLQRVPGVVGRRLDLREMLRDHKLSAETYNAVVQQDRAVGGEYLTEGALGCLESHVEAWRRVVAADRWMMVFEDDVRLAPRFDEAVQAAVAELPPDAGLLYFGNVIGDAIASSLHNYSASLWSMSGDHWGTYAYMVSPAAARTLLRYVYPADKQVDSMIIRIAAQRRIRVFMSKTLAVFVDNGQKRVSNVQRYDVAAQLIPKTLHFIWLGGQPLPANLRYNMQRWRDLHPTWEVQLWTEANIPPLRNAGRFAVARTLAQQSDIVRYEILLAHGGVYADLDFEPLRNIEPLLHGLRAFVAYESDVFICNGILGTVPGHALPDRLVRDLDSNWGRFASGTVNQQSGPHYMTATVKAMGLTMDDGFRAFAPHIFFPYRWGEPDPGPPYPALSYAVHDFEKGAREGERQ
jgi:GR25 family glycosyltransferase involved in LPS biosynthesis